MRLANKVALITGASTGIGRASAIMFAKEGARVAIADINDAGGQETINAIKAAGGEAIYIHADLSKRSDIKRMIETTVDKFGKVDILFNNAGYYLWPHKLDEITEEEWDMTFTVNVKAIFLAAQYVVPEMKKIGGGVIINTASMAGIRPRAHAAYGSSKAAAIGLTKALALQLAPFSIRVNVINPTAVETPLMKKFLGVEKDEDLEKIKKERVKAIPLGRVAQPEDIAYAALYLASDESAMLTGDSINVDGGTGI
ncbi:SDR family NAD(P)-dependent oxidoreductase [Chloroflexota bacterium]